MAKTFYLEILTPEKEFFKGEAESVIMPAIDGEYGVQAGHEPVVKSHRRKHFVECAYISFCGACKQSLRKYLIYRNCL